jgi:hypothetical protein
MVGGFFKLKVISTCVYVSSKLRSDLGKRRLPTRFGAPVTREASGPDPPHADDGCSPAVTIGNGLFYGGKAVYYPKGIVGFARTASALLKPCPVAGAEPTAGTVPAQRRPSHVRFAECRSSA